MKLYILMSSYDYEGSSFLGLYSSLEKAVADLDKKEGTEFFGDGFYVIESGVDSDICAEEDKKVVFERDRK